MDFGKLDNLTGVDFSMPPITEATQQMLQRFSADKPMAVFVGCPVWANPAWVGSLYPPRAKEKDFLKHYTHQFNTIELNVTHYRIPDLQTVRRWTSAAAAGVEFCPKFLQEISHHKLLQGDFQQLTLLFCESILAFEQHLGVSFLQLPPYSEPIHLDKLQNFLDFLATHCPIPLAIEFRHPLWFKDDQLEKVAQMLENYHVGTVITDVAGRRDVLHSRLTTPVCVIRFVGNSLHPSDYSRVDAWVERINQWATEGLQAVYFFAHEPDNVLAPDLAIYFIEKLNQALKMQLPLPQLHDELPPVKPSKPNNGQIQLF